MLAARPGFGVGVLQTSSQAVLLWLCGCGSSVYTMECWICLSGEECKGSSPFSSFCDCSPSVRPVHARCLGRWQLQRAGTR